MPEPTAELWAHWPLQEDGTDLSGHGRHLSGQATFLAPPTPGASPMAWFDGTGPGLSALIPPLGLDDFTLTATVWTHPELTSSLGDVVSIFNPETRNGVNLTLLNLSGVTSSHPNDRTVLFGVDAGTAPTFTDHGKLGSAYFVTGFAVVGDTLYAATSEGGAGAVGRVFSRRAGDSGWTDHGSPDEANTVAALAVLDGNLYAGTSNYNRRGTALGESPNDAPGGAVHRYVGNGTWEPCGLIDPGSRYAGKLHRSPMRSRTADSIGALCVHGGSLYAIPAYSEGLFRYAGGTEWIPCGSPGFRLMALCSHGGELYCAGNEGGGVVTTHGAGDWTPTPSLPPEVFQVSSFAVDRGELVVGVWPDGRVHALTDDGWSPAGHLGSELQVTALAHYNGMLYGGTLPSAELHRRDHHAWTFLDILDDTEHVLYRQIWAMAVFDGELYCGTLPSGRVISMRSGTAVTNSLTPGLHRLTAIRRSHELTLHVDDRQVAVRDGLPLDLRTTTVRIGAGPHSAFTGGVSDVRVYAGAQEPRDAT